MLRSILFYSILGLAGLAAEAQGTFKLGSRCYEAFLAGSIVDSFACKETLVRVVEKDCQSQAHKANHRIMGKLSNCSPTSVNIEAKVPNGDLLHFRASQAPNSGSEMWALKPILQAHPVAAPASGLVKPAPPSPPNPVAEPTDTFALTAEQRWAQSFLLKGWWGRIALASEWNLVGRKNMDSVKSQGFLGDNQSLVPRDRFANGFAIDEVSIGKSVRFTKLWSAQIELAGGPGFGMWNTSPYARISGSEFGLREATFNYESKNTYFRAGQFASPAGWGDMLASPAMSMGETYLVPHFENGITAITKFGSFNFQTTLSNGWNRNVGNVSHPTVGLNLGWTDGYSKAKFGILYGNEASALVSDKFLSFHGGYLFPLFSKLRLMFLYRAAQFDNAIALQAPVKLSSIEARSEFDLSSQSTLSAAIESFENEEGFLFSDPVGKGFYNAAISWERRITNSLRADFGWRMQMFKRDTAGSAFADRHYLFSQLEYKF